MSVPLDNPVTGCKDCANLYVRALNARGDLGDTKKKLVRHQDDEALRDRYVADLEDRKARVAIDQEAYWAHRAEVHPRANATPFANLGNKYQAESVELPPASELVDMLDDGWTRKSIAEEYGCGESTVAQRIAASGILEQRKREQDEAAGQLVDVFASLWDADWIDDALCAQTDPDGFFPEKGGSVRAAKATCMTCDVREQCLQAALDSGERFGVWGGKTERERRKILLDRKREQRGETAETTTCIADGCDQALPEAAPAGQVYCSRSCASRASYDRSRKPKTEVA